EEPETPVVMFVILKMISGQMIPLQTFAPRFTGGFNQGHDQEGDVRQFSQDFERDVLVIDYAVRHVRLPVNLELSVHSGSDNFTIYPVMADIIKRYDKGLDIKSAGTTWLEEVIGLAISGVEGLAMAKDIYAKALSRKRELCGPYADVI